MKAQAFALGAVLLAAAPAEAGVILTFTGTVTRVTAANTPPSTPAPFALGQSLHARIEIPQLTSGAFSVAWPVLFIDGVPYQPFTTTGIARFGEVVGENTIPFWPQAPQSLAGVLTPQGELTAMTAWFCCNFTGPVAPGGQEDGQLRIDLTRFDTLYLPLGAGGPGLPSISGSGTGTWSVTIIPEPASLALLGGGLLGLALAVAGRPRPRSG